MPQRDTTASVEAIEPLAGGDEERGLAVLRRDLSPLLETAGVVEQRARHWIEKLRADGPPRLGLESLLLEYRLDTREGVALMCLAEALLRIPDAAAAERLIHDVLAPVAWQSHVGHSEDVFVNAASWGLALTGRWLETHEQPSGQPQAWLERIATRIGDTLLRQALQKTVRYLADQFVLAETLPAALRRAETDWQRGFTHSFDMLGEAALTGADSQRYFAAYRDAIAQAGRSVPPAALPRPNVSIKLSALHPRYTTSQWPRLERELIPELCALCRLAAAQEVALSIDAEEAERLELSLRIFTAVMAQLDAAERRGLGIVVQAYNLRAIGVLKYLHSVAQRFSVRLPVRLVKGAYWDSEIKRAQQRGLDGYPIYTRKTLTDLSYLACAQFLLAHPHHFYPQFATHNAITISALLTMGNGREFELQRLHGMGEALYALVHREHPHIPCRIYAPIGAHRELLPYLVRRLLENGANNSFLHQLYDRRIPAETLARHPLRNLDTSPLPLPAALFAPQRINSPGIDLHRHHVRAPLFAEIAAHRERIETAARASQHGFAVINPASGERIGAWLPHDVADIDAAIQRARHAQTAWCELGVDARAVVLERLADLLLAQRAELVALMALETGKTLENALEEIRETIDYCRYYAAQARVLLAHATALPGPAGEQNTLWLRPRGVFASISPWNFPLAIFTGQIIAALVTGNAVMAKPAEQATLTAQRTIELMHAAGIPRDVLQLVCGEGETIGRALCAHEGIDGVVFTGGFATAKHIQREIAARAGAIVPLIAETAGLNCLIADSSAQPQQLVNDVLRSAFDSAGQRCSALRVLYLPTGSAAGIEELLIGAMRTLQLGAPLDWSTDIGPIIDHTALEQLRAHVDGFREQGKLLFQGDAPDRGFFFSPALIQLDSLAELTGEAFGPILHIVHYDEHKTEAIVEAINAAGFGLTCGIHSRNSQRAQKLARQLRVGNCYINRDMIGAVVGAQPFGGSGKSGTGPKAGGPFYLPRFCVEQTITENTAALGGDPQLLAGAPG